MTDAPVFIDSGAVATLLGQTPGHFLSVRARLEDQEGFPLPVPHWRRPLKYRRDQVLGWIEAQGRPRGQPEAVFGPNVVLFQKARRA